MEQVAEAAKERWGFDDAFGSDYEAVDGVLTGRILEHIGDEGKINCLRLYCQKHNILPERCVAVGDGTTDIPLFGFCGGSIAINASEAARQKAVHSLFTDRLDDILEFI